MTFVQFLEELERSNQVVVIPGEEVERLVERFGSNVRAIGWWNKTGDGSVEIPMGNITEAVQMLGDRALAEAVEQLKSLDHFAGMLSSSSAAGQLIEKLSKLHLRQFQRKVERYQDSSDPAEVEQLRLEISQELFGA